MKARKESFLPGFAPRSGAGSPARSHGGELSRGRRKEARPIDPKQALHVVLRSSLARGSFSMLDRRHQAHIHDFLQALSRRWGVRVYRFANVGNHLHLLVRVPSRAVWRRFIREFAGGVAIIVTGAKKGEPVARATGQGQAAAPAKRGFWDHLVFTRIVNFGRDFDRSAQYLIKNLFEAAGVPMKKLLAQGYRLMSIEGESPPGSREPPGGRGFSRGV